MTLEEQAALDAEKNKNPLVALAELLKDPKNLEFAIAKAQMDGKLPKVEQQRQTLPVDNTPKERVWKPEMPTLGENPTVADLLKVMSERENKLLEHITGIISDKTMSVKADMVESQKEKLAREVREFAKEHKHFTTVMEDMDALYRTGKYNMEEAYDKACKSNGLDPKEGTAKATSTQEDPSKVSSLRVLEETAIPVETKTPFKSIEEAAKANMKNMVAKVPGLEEILQGG